MDGPDQIGPDHSPKRTLGEKFSRLVKTFTTRYDQQHELDEFMLMKD